MRFVADQMMAKTDGTALPARATAIAALVTTKTTGTKKTAKKTVGG